MATGNGTQTTATPRPGWRGSQPRQAPEHRWQQMAGGALVSGGASRALRAGLLFALAGGLLLLLVCYLLYSPAQTPVLAVVATRYDWPLPPNAWAAEDLAALTADLGSENVRVTDLSADWRSAESGLVRLDKELKSLAGRSRHSPAVVIYLSLHGATDAAGRPCLIPEGARPHDERTWLPLADVLARIKAAGFPEETHKLVVLDASRQLVNWNTGLVYNGLAEGLEQAVIDADVPNLAVLSSAGPGQSAAASPELRGSVFGHFFRLGLAGAADGRDFGNRDGRVSLAELAGYLAREVDSWRQHHRGESQTPVVVPAVGQSSALSYADFTVTWSVNARARRRIASAHAVAERAAPSIAPEALAKHWSDLDELRSGRLWRFDPVAWRTLEQHLLWLEQLRAAGKAYDAEASRLSADLGRRLSAARERLAQARRTGSLPAYTTVLGGSSTLTGVRAHSLPLARFWGTFDRDLADGLQQHLQRCEDDPSGQHLAAALAAFRDASLAAGLDEANYLGIWQRLAVPGVWSDSAGLGGVLAAHSAAEALATPQSGGELPGDERAHAWLRGRLMNLDRERRALEDAVLIGPPAGNLAGVEQLSESLAGLASDDPASRAFALRDEIWAEAPYLAAWLCRPQTDAKSQQQADALVRQSLVPLLNDALALEKQLERREAEAGQADLDWGSDALVAALEARWNALQSHLQTEIDRLSAAEETGAAVADIDALLAVPAVRSDARQRLNRKRFDVADRLARRYDAPDAGAGQVAEPPGAGLSYLERINTAWDGHPLALLLGRVPVKVATEGVSSVAEPKEGAARLAALSHALRGKLAELSLADLTQAGQPATSRFDADKPPAAGLVDLCRAESIYRAAAGLWFDPPPVDPVRELRRADLQQLLLWRADRALDDFYGSASGEPFFAQAAGSYLEGARQLGPMSGAATAEADAIRARLTERRVAASDALEVSATDLLLVEQSPSVTSTLVVRAKLPEGVAGLPASTAAVFLADAAGRLGDTGAVELPRADASSGQVLAEALTTFDTAGLKEREAILRAVVSVRGNDFAAPVLLRAPGGAHVEFDVPRYGPPTVTVLGFEQKRASVVFILDCSHSMRDPVSVERPDGNESTRMTVAKDALKSLLRELAEQGNASVGVRFFGHRVGWSREEAGKLMRQAGYKGEIPANLRPDGDVELVLRLGRFDSIAAGLVSDKLDSVIGWGETPLYLAISQALADFSGEETGERSIVVITDGQNNQFNPSSENRRSLDQVLAELNRTQIPVHIVGFDLPAEEASTAEREYSQIASRNGGSYTPASSATTLAQTLQTLLRPGEFRVATRSGVTVGQAELGSVVAIDGHAGRERYEVDYESAREAVELAGGEAVELGYRRADRRLEVAPYKWDDPRFPLVRANDAPTDLVAAVHRSVRVEGAVRFPISLQHRERHYVARPLEMWIEIEPRGRALLESERATFVFYDAAFDAGTTVPLATLVAHGWPAAADRAAVSIWFKDQTTPVAHQRMLADVADRVPDQGDGFTVPGIEGLTYQVRTVTSGSDLLAIGVVERHDRRSAGVGSVKVALSPAPDHVAHRFDPQNRIVLHTFTYRQASPDLRERIALQFTGRSEAQEGAIRLAQPVEIDVSDRSDLLDLTPLSAR